MIIDRTKLRELMDEADKHSTCQRGLIKGIPYQDRPWIEGQICKYCQESYCGIDEEILQALAEELGTNSRDLMFGTEEERQAVTLIRSTTSILED